MLPRTGFINSNSGGRVLSDEELDAIRQAVTDVVRELAEVGRVQVIVDELNNEVN